MTTIAVRDGIVAADSQETNSHYKQPCHKLYKAKNAVIGTAGDSFNGMVFVEWYRDRRKAKPTTELDRPFECLVVTSSTIEIWNELLVPLVIHEPFWAIGHGGGIAMGAMAAGASAKEAVEIACRYDLYSIGPVETMAVKQRTRRK